MRITETTPPVERKFSIEVTESELQHLALILGQINALNLKDLVEKEPWGTKGFKGFVYDIDLLQPLYNTLIDAARS